MIKNFLIPKGHQNPSKVTTIFLKGWLWWLSCNDDDDDDNDDDDDDDDDDDEDNDDDNDDDDDDDEHGLNTTYVLIESNWGGSKKKIPLIY